MGHLMSSHRIIVYSLCSVSGYTTKKVWSIFAFIWIEALAKPRTNKQYPTPVWICAKNDTICRYK